MGHEVKTWHYGLVAREWAEHNNDGPEIAYFQRQIENYGQPALDAGCGTGRLLLPFLRAGLDVDGCDVSGDMLGRCREKAELEGLRPQLYRQALHELALPRRYRSIVACGVFGIGVSREQDAEALRRFYGHLQPGGVLLLENYFPYRSAKEWQLWRKDGRSRLPDPWPDWIGTTPPTGTEYELYARVVDLDPLEQHLTREMRTLLWRDGRPVADQTYTLTENLYFRNELRAMLAHAGFRLEAEKGDWTDEDAGPDHGVIVFFARK